MCRILALAFCALAATTVAKREVIPTGFQHKRVATTVFVTSPAVKQRSAITLENHGDAPLSEYYITVPLEWAQKLSFIGVKDKNGRLKMEEVKEAAMDSDATGKGKSKKSPDLLEGARVFRAALKGPLPADSGKSSVELTVTIGLMHVLEPLPKEIKRTSKQLIHFTGNRYFYSPYPSKSSTIKFVLATDKFKSLPKPFQTQEKNKVTYETEKNVAALKKNWMAFHFEWKGPILTITELVRDIEVSHWGNVRFEDRFQIRHDGAKLKGAFEPGTNRRYVRTRDPAAVASLDALLPLNAHGVYYVDRIGNISSSHFRKTRSKSLLELDMRYPLYGGWKTDFVIGYDVPSQDLIVVDSATGIHTLNVSFGVPMREPITDRLTTQIALPEGAYDVAIHCPFEIAQEPMQRRFTYLDTRMFGGRPLVVFHKDNVIHLHNEYYQISYRIAANQIYYKPALLTAGVFGFFFVIMLIFRINPTLSSTEEIEWKKQESTKLHRVPGSKRSFSVRRGSFDSMVAELKLERSYFQEQSDLEAVSKISRAIKKLRKQKGNQTRMNEIIDSLQSQLKASS